MRVLIVFFASIAAFSADAHAATMFKCIDASGKISYGDRPCAYSANEAWSARPGTRPRSAPRLTDKLRPAQLATVTGTQGQSALPAAAKFKPRPQELARISRTPRMHEAGENARIEELRRQEMLRITGQQG